MEFRSAFPLVLAASLVAACTALFGQPVQESAASPYKVTPIIVKAPPMPFPPGTGTQGPVTQVEFRSPEQMTQKDRDVEADGESSIRERVGFNGLEFNEGKWSYQQIVCSAFPNHILLKFTRNNGKGDESVFTASIPRMGEGRVRIIPILRRGYSLFSPAPVNALTISVFNHIRAEEQPQGPPDWLSTGMCYAALAGAHPQVEPGIENTEARKFRSGQPAILEIPVKGGAVITFLDVAAAPKPMEWSMIFDAKGKLLKATHTPAPWTLPTDVPQTLVQIKGTPIPATLMEVNGRP
jgi:hypothetical protein